MMLIDLAQGRADTTRLHEGLEQITTALFRGEGQLTLVYGASTDGRMQLCSIFRDGGRSHQLTTDAANLIQPQISPDGRWIAATRVHRSKELRRMSLQ